MGENLSGKLLLVPTRQQEAYFIKHFASHPQFSVLTPRGTNSFSLDGKHLLLNFEKSKFLKDYKKVVSELLELTPIYSRHGDSMMTLDLDIRLLANSIIGLADFISNEKVLGVNFSFESSHHIYTQVIEKACKLAEVIQTFEYPVNNSSWFITFLQRQSIQDRASIELLSNDLAGVPDECDEWVMDTFCQKSSLDSSFKDSLLRELCLAKHSFTFATLFLFFGNWRSKAYTYRRKLLYWLFKSGREKWSGEMTFKPRGLLGTQSNILKLRRALTYYQSKSSDSIGKITEAWNKIEQNGELPLIFYAHFQPEATTFPECVPYANITDAIVEIRNSGYSNPIFYKEHPHMKNFYFDKRVAQGGTARSIKFYQSLEELGCFLVPFTFKLDDQQKFMVITGNGTIAIERSILGLKTVVLGWAWYRGISGILSLEDYVSNHKSTNYFLDIEANLSGIESIKNLVKTHATCLLGYWYDSNLPPGTYMEYLILLRNYLKTCNFQASSSLK